MNKELVLVFTILIFHQALLGNARHANFGTRALNSRIFMDRMYPVEQIYVEHHVDHHVHIIPCQITCNQPFAKFQLEKSWDLAFYHLMKLHAVDCLQDADHVSKHVVSKQT